MVRQLSSFNDEQHGGQTDMDKPNRGDYITLLHLGIPSENHARVEQCLGIADGPGRVDSTFFAWYVIDETGEEHVIVRNWAYDNETRRAWVEYRPNKHGVRWHYDLYWDRWIQTPRPPDCRP